MQFKNYWSQFLGRHPKLPKFFNAISQDAIKEGTVIEVHVTTAEGQNYVSNLKLTAEDVQVFQEVKNT